MHDRSGYAAASPALSGQAGCERENAKRINALTNLDPTPSDLAQSADVPIALPSRPGGVRNFSSSVQVATLKLTAPSLEWVTAASRQKTLCRMRQES